MDPKQFFFSFFNSFMRMAPNLSLSSSLRSPSLLMSGKLWQDPGLETSIGDKRCGDCCCCCCCCCCRCCCCCWRATSAWNFVRQVSAREWSCLSNVKSCIVNSHSLNRKISKPLSKNSSMVFRMIAAHLDVSIFHLLGQLEPQAILDELRGVLLHRGRGHRWQVAREGIWRRSEWLKRYNRFERTELGKYFWF